MKTLRFFILVSFAFYFFTACEQEIEIVPETKSGTTLMPPFDLEAKGVLPEKESDDLFIELEWTDGISAKSGFIVERSLGDSTHWKEIARLDKGTTSFNDTELQGDSTFYYRVKAIGSGQNFSYSSSAYFFWRTYKPNAPSNLRAMPLSTPGMDLSWQDNANNELGFIIQRSLNGSSWTEVERVKANITSYQDRGLQEATAYYYRVMAYNLDYRTYTYVNSSSSNVAINVTLKFIDAPSDLKAEALAGTPLIKLEWTDNSNDEQNFVIERRLNGEALWYEIDRVDDNITSYVDLGTEIYTNYFYRIHALSGNIKSANTEAVSVTSKDFPLPESYISFNPDDLELEQSSITGWLIKSNETTITGYKEFSQAFNVIDVLKHYNINRLYQVPGLSYFMVNNESPSGAMDGEDCIPFDPDKIEVEMINGLWIIVDTETRQFLYSYGPREKDKALIARRIIKKYGFTYTCYLGRPNTYFKYLKK